MLAWTEAVDTDDELDPRRAPAGPEAAEVVDEGDPLRQRLGDGLPDPTQSVRLWVDENHRLVRVRLSSRWRQYARSGADLASMVMSALFLAQLRTAEGSFLPEVIAPEPEVEKGGYSIAAIRRRRERMRELLETEVAPPRLVGGGSTGRGARGRVVVTLGQLGDTESIEIDEEWFDDATDPMLTAALLEAHEDAYDRFAPPVWEMEDYIAARGEMRRLRREIEIIQQRF